ncbi:MAG: hypothetical protein AAF770_00830 [Bacteroidota bacterium]
MKVTSLDKNAEVEEKEQVNDQILLEEKFLSQIENTLHKTEKTFDICIQTENLIPRK